jgi:hypothetical protein
MRLKPMLLTAAAAGLIAVAAAAQDAQPPAEPAAKAEPGLSDLSNTVEGLQDEAPAPAQAEAAPPARTPAPAPPPPPPAPAPAAGPPAPLTGADRAALEASVARGRLIGGIARAGLMATRDMLSRVSDPDGAGITGWIAEAEGNGSTVTFYADTPTGPVVVYRADILGGRVVSRDVFLAGNRPPLNPIQARMAAARAATAGLDHQVCGGQDFDVLVVPPATADGPIDVYQISQQGRPGHVPLGGHFKTSVAADGTVSASRGFTNSCLDVAVPVTAAGARPAPIAVTHLLDPLPQDIHVFLSILTGHPLVVVAGDPQRLFQVTSAGIAEIPR